MNSKGMWDTRSVLSARTSLSKTSDTSFWEIGYLKRQTVVEIALIPFVNAWSVSIFGMQYMPAFASLYMIMIHKATWKLVNPWLKANLLNIILLCPKMVTLV
ncbi:hypothetical protein DCC62_26430 [candidate division KSB1 bacterium]|nr:MAG: hypothetical protein DCC62_26430 [candidate division KSB1 bacterium]